MIHLTLTGPLAGFPLCDVNKQEAKEEGDTFAHAMYWKNWEHEELCQECKHIWFDDEEFDNFVDELDDDEIKL